MAARDMEMSARVNGIASQFEKFDFLFGVMLGEKVLRLADNLSRTLQQKQLSAAEGNHAALLTCDTLSALRSDSEFTKFWDSVQTKLNDVHVSEPVLPRRRKTPRRLEVGTGESHFPETVQDYYRAQYFEALDLLTSCIKDRFDQPGYRIYSNLEALLLNSANGVEFMAEFDEIMQLYAQDFNQELLKSQLAILKTHFNDHSEPVRLAVVHEFLMNLGEAQSLLIVLSEVVELN